MCCSRFPRGLDKLYDILDGSWMSAVTGGLYKVCYLITLHYPTFTRLHDLITPHYLPHLMTLTCRQRSSATTGKPASGMLCLTTACWSSRSWSVSSVSFYHRPFGMAFSFLMPRLETGGRSCVPSSISRFLRLLTPGFQLYLKACYS